VTPPLGGEAARRIALFVRDFAPLAPGGNPFKTIPVFDAAASPGTGVEAGFGRVDGRPVAVFAMDPAVSGGSVGLGEARKVCALMDAALERGCPVVGLLQSGGARIQEGVDSLAGYGEIFRRNVEMSGRVPQVSVILGPCAGGAVYSPALTDAVVMVRGQGEMYITGPDVIRRSTGEEVDRESLGGAAVHLAKSGVAHLGAASPEEAALLVARLLSYLPSRRGAPPPIAPFSGKAAKPPEEWMTEGKMALDVRPVVASVVDEGSFLELQAEFAPNLAVGLARLEGAPVGVVANNSAHSSGALDIAASQKGARFIRLCDAFGLPVVTFVDVPGYWPGVGQEHGGIIRHGADLLRAYAAATVTRLTVVLRKAYGGAYDVMSSKHLGASASAAWPTAEIAVMGPQGAVEILHRREIAAAADPAAERERLASAYRRDVVNPRLALSRGYVDEVVPPERTRAWLCAKLKGCDRV
jgi:acetyl-CoA/propionyl-CoA carboxylase carboxyl transferase subunit